jgi:Zn-finger nucleic acid-binding protein
VDDDVIDGRQLRGEPLRCPTDGARLVQTERSEILIDACPQCRGVWLDRGELDRILVKERQWASGDADEDFFGEVEGRRGERDRDRDPEEQGGRRKRRRGGFFEDLFEGFGD